MDALADICTATDLYDLVQHSSLVLASGKNVHPRAKSASRDTDLERSIKQLQKSGAKIGKNSQIPATSSTTEELAELTKDCLALSNDITARLSGMKTRLKPSWKQRLQAAAKTGHENFQLDDLDGRVDRCRTGVRAFLDMKR
jgi:hypothetical protein